MIRKDMSIGDVLKKYPEAISVFEEFGLGCIGCRAALFEDIEEGARVHGVDVEALVANLNRVIVKR